MNHLSSFNLDFHSISFFGKDPFVEKHWVPRRIQRRKAVLAFLAQDAEASSSVPRTRVGEANRKGLPGTSGGRGVCSVPKMRLIPRMVLATFGSSKGSGFAGGGRL
jgi:hypothetical protein